MMILWRRPGSGSSHARLAVARQYRVRSGFTPVSAGAVWPSPSDVRAGVTYGPTGSDYTGTLTSTGGVSKARAVNA